MPGEIISLDERRRQLEENEQGAMLDEAALAILAGRMEGARHRIVSELLEFEPDQRLTIIQCVGADLYPPIEGA